MGVVFEYVNGPVPASGQVGNALRFNGTNYVVVGDSDLWAFGTQDFTIELWANFDTPGGGTLIVPSHVFIGNDEGPGSRNKWFFALGEGSLFFHSNGPLGGQRFPIAPFSPNVGQWYHLAITRNGSAWTIFINGIPSATDTDVSPVPDANAPLTIGQAEDLGFMNGRLDEITIYNRALSQAELQAIVTADSAGKCKALTITTPSLSAVPLGKFFAQQLEARFGQPPFVWSLVNGSLPSGVTLSPDGILSGIPTEAGNFVFTVGVTDNTNAHAEKKFTLTNLVTLPPPDIRITKTGTLAVPGRIMDYFIVVENNGQVTGTNVEVLEVVDPAFFTLLSVDPPAVTDISTLADASVILWIIPTLNVGEVRILSYKVRLAPTTPLSSIVPGGPACSGENLLPTWSNCLVRAILTEAMCAPCQSAFVACAALCVGTVATAPACLTCLASSTQACAKIGPGPIGLGGCIPFAFDTAKACLEAGKGTGEVLFDCFTQFLEVFAAVDPNEKGVAANRFIQPDQLLVYPIHFENIGNAEARDVFVTDVLAPNLDITTLQILTPGGSFNPTTRTLRWDLLGINLQPNATGNVVFSIRPQPNLPSGTEIRNSATIQFEVFTPLATNEVVNVIDSTPPHCTMNALPPVTLTSDFSLSWNGTDAVGQVDTFTIFMAVNGGSFTPFLEKTRDTQTTFHGAAGKTYGFICIAADTAGNVEVKNPVAEVTTKVQTPNPDTTPPVITVTAKPSVLWPPNNKLVPVVISGTITDNLSGVDLTSARYSVVDEYKLIQPSGSITVNANGSYSFTIQLQASRNENDKDGRHYTITISAQDKVGNKGSATTSVTVPHDQVQ